LPNLVGTSVSYAYAVKPGPWIFLTGHEAHDWHTGRVDDAISGPPGYAAACDLAGKPAQPGSGGEHARRRRPRRPRVRSAEREGTNRCQQCR
jgi:hypothetical protein